jgi:hypothetical protein
MATNNRITTTELDFDQIKTNLKNYLKGQSQFQDYDFEGSSLAILLDILAYNTHYTALYDNLAINEAFIDSASKRESVVSIAKELGYVPTSATCSQATINLIISSPSGGGNLLELPKYSLFSATSNGVTYNFYNTENLYAYLDTATNTYTFSNVVIKEGTPLTFQYTVTDTSQYLLQNPNIDVKTLKVTVQENANSSVYTAFTRAENLLTVNSTTNAYFLKEIANKQYQLEFGNGTIGTALIPGNVVNVEYLTCNLTDPNGISVFTYKGSTLANGVASVVTVSPSSLGADVEDIESVRWNAPRAYTTQNRCVTLDDFISTVYNYYSNAQTVNAWGGETNIPKSYGDVFISIKPKNKDYLTDAEKSDLLTNVLQPRCAVTIHPKIVDPEYINVELNVAYYYDPTATARAPLDITNLVKNTVIDYNNANLVRFGGILKYSALLGDIVATEQSISSAIVTLKLHRAITPVFNTAPNYVVNLVNPIYNSGVPEESVLSNGLNVYGESNVCYIDDLPTEGSTTGKLRLFYLVNNTKVLVKYVGTLDYANGIISISNLILTGTVDGTFTLVIKPQSNDVVSIRNQIVNIDSTLLSITPVIDKNAEQYVFTSSRN